MDKVQVRHLVLIFTAFLGLSGCDWMISEAYLNIKFPLVDPASFQDNPIDAAINPYLIEGMARTSGAYPMGARHFSNKKFKENLLSIGAPIEVLSMVKSAGGYCYHGKDRAYCIYRKIIWSLDPVTKIRKAITNVQKCHVYQFSFPINSEITEETLNFKYASKSIWVSVVDDFSAVKEKCVSFAENSLKALDLK